MPRQRPAEVGHKRSYATLPVQWAEYGIRPAVEDVGVDLRRRHILVPQQFLDRANVAPRLQHVGGERVPKRMG